MPIGPCKICAATNYPLSYGGPDICPACDCGIPSPQQFMRNKSFNKLTSAEAERLALLSEESGEVQQAIGKILRHGYESRYPDDGPTNRETLEREIGDVYFAIQLMITSDDLELAAVTRAKKRKAVKVWQYLHHQSLNTGDLWRHDQECASDSFARSVCEGMHSEKQQKNQNLCEALRSVYALLGEDKTIKKIIDDALEENEIGV